MAIVGHSYYYHTRKDIIKNIERGSSQHFVSNVMAIVDRLLGPNSPLHDDTPWSPPDIVYMSLYDRVFLHWTMKSADVAYVAIATVSATMALANLNRQRIKAFVLAFAGAPLGLLMGVVVANLVAGVMTLIGQQMTWFSHEGYCVALYGPAAMIGHLGTQHFLGGLLSPLKRESFETAQYYGQLLFLTICSLLVQSMRVRSAYLFAGLASVLLLGAVGGEVTSLVTGRKGIPFLGSYILPLTLLMALALEAYTSVLDIFVPLTGRMGKDAPVEFIIATITAACTIGMFPISAPLFTRASRRAQRGVLTALFLATATVFIIFVGPWWSPYDAEHPKRMGVQYTYNHTDGQHTAHLAFMDQPHNYRYALEFHEEYGKGAELVKTEMNDYNSDWDVLYPVSTFLETYKFALEPVKFDRWPEMTHEESRTLLANGNTNIKIKLHHPGCVWPALAFEADIVEWSFDLPPPKGRTRHHIKSATSVDVDILELDLVLKLDKGEKLKLHWSAVGE